MDVPLDSFDSSIRLFIRFIFVALSLFPNAMLMFGADDPSSREAELLQQERQRSSSVNERSTKYQRRFVRPWRFDSSRQSIPP